MKFNRWTIGLAAAGVISLPSVMQAEEASKTVMTALSSTTLSGYVDTSIMWKPGTGNANLAGHNGDDAGGKLDRFNVNVVKLSLEKPVDAGNWSAGYKVDLLFGPDAFGYGTQSNPGFAKGDVAIKQAYVALRAPIGNGLDLKLGTFDTIIGFEVFDRGSNPHYSRSFGYVLEPTTYTGLLASYKFSDMFSASAGIANSVAGAPGIAAAGSGTESEKAYMASLSITAPDSAGFMKGAALSLGVVDHASAGAAAFGAPTVANLVNYYAGLVIPLGSKDLTLGLAYDYQGRSADRFGTPLASASTTQNAAAVYVSWQATEKLKINGRADYASGDPGFLGHVVKPGAKPNDGDKQLAFTGTADYKLWDNVVSRVELRWDHSADGTRSFGGTVAGAPINRNALTAAVNVIYKF